MDYESLGLKCGLEIHQQIAGEKLFCNCPTKTEEGAFDFKIERRLRASAGETGEVDKAAKHEQEKEKKFIYKGYKEKNCLVELDEEPPRPMNKEALKTVLKICKMMNSNILERVQVMRKTVVDGSNTAGFQRTALVALGGELEEEKVGVDTVCIEEDSCKIISREKEKDTYNLTRLGIPLIEIATAPDIKTPG